MLNQSKNTETLIPNEYLCPITLSLMRDPVLAADGHSYERTAISKWLQKHDTSPKNGNKLEHLNLTTNHAIRSLIEEFKERCISQQQTQYSQPKEADSNKEAQKQSSLDITISIQDSQIIHQYHQHQHLTEPLFGEGRQQITDTSEIIPKYFKQMPTTLEYYVDFLEIIPRYFEDGHGHISAKEYYIKMFPPHGFAGSPPNQPNFYGSKAGFLTHAYYMGMQQFEITINEEANRRNFFGLRLTQC